MADLFEQARAYYQSAASDPWRWADDASVLVWADGATIAFREELAEILDGLASDGLPPFRLVVLILAACKGKFPPSSASGHVLRERIHPAQLELPPPLEGRNESETAKVWNDPANQEFSELIARLRLLHQLPPEQRESPKVKAALIETILEQLSVNRVQPAREIARSLGELPALRDLNGAETRVLLESITAYRLLHASLKNFSALSFALRLRTGLDALPSAAKVELKPSERARQLLASLRTDPEQQGLAKVARDIMAAIYLPRSLSELDELALGGFSDIANRGSLDRLLPSELANDDLTLATRIALNEALYIRREPPSNHPPAQLAILLDVGLRQWGMPRVFASAVALAFIAKEERCTEVAVWRAGRGTLEKADLLTRSGLVEHLAALETYVHPGPVLRPFFAQFAQQPEMEAVLVTHRDSLSDPDFLRHLAEIDWKRFYIATVDRDGSFELLAHPNRQKPLSQAEISLQELFPEKTETRESVAPALRDQKKDLSLPLILNTRPFPFLLPVLEKIESCCRLENGGGLAITSDRRLVRWDSANKGTYTLIERLLPGKTLWLAESDNGKRVHVVKVLAKTGTASLTSWNAITGDVVTTELKFGKGFPQHVYEHQGILYVLCGCEVSTWHIMDGRPAGTAHLPVGCSFTQTRYIHHHSGIWSLLSHNGAGICFEPVKLPTCFKSIKILTLFDRPDLEAGPWALTAQGQILSSEGECVVNLGKWVGFKKISRDGQRVFLTLIGEKDAHFINLKDGSVRQIPAGGGKNALAVADLLLEPRTLPPSRSVRVNFTDINIAPGEELMLRSAKGAWLKVSLEAKSLRLVRVAGAAAQPESSVKFEPLRISPEYNFRLKVASWPDSSRAWLDSRGLLHLKRGNSSNPEVSLVLADGPMAAWSSDGKICGPDYFLHKPALAEAATLKTRIELFCPIA
jgi:hypothetical protein